jgi:pyridoxine kinase
MDKFTEEWGKLGLRFDGILTGFLGSVEQIEIVSRFMSRFKTDENITVIDPVMGDGGKLYPTYSPLLADKMSELVAYADILTPNLTEACILTKTEYDKDMDDAALLKICEKLEELGPKKIVISGLERGEDLANFIYESDSAEKWQVLTEHKAGPCRAGTGDVFSSIIAADAVLGRDMVASVAHASSFIAKSLRKTAELGMPLADGICFEEYLSEINEGYNEDLRRG